MSKIVVVHFPNSCKDYYYYTDLTLTIGGVYDIIADGEYKYSSPVTVVNYVNTLNKKEHKNKLRKITFAKCITMPPRPTSPIKKVIFNEKKKVTVVLWEDGTKTKLRCSDEIFDKEKAIGLAFMKKIFHNRGCFNDELRKWIND